MKYKIVKKADRYHAYVEVVKRKWFRENTAVWQMVDNDIGWGFVENYFDSEEKALEAINQLKTHLESPKTVREGEL